MSVENNKNTFQRYVDEVWKDENLDIADEIFAEKYLSHQSDGTGRARLDLMPAKEQICYTLTVSNIGRATAAHIHRGTATEAGPILKELEAPSDGSSQGCVRLSRTAITNIKNNPSGYYVNVHNRAFPNGAIRGQLHN